MENKIAMTGMALTAGAMMLLFTFGASAQSIETGDATSGTVIENVVNTNIIRCCTLTPIPPTPTVEQPTPTEVPPTPTNLPPSNGGNGGVGGQGGTGGGEAPSAQGQVLGLATTSGENELFNLLKLLPAFGSLAVGYGLLRKNA